MSFTLNSTYGTDFNWTIRSYKPSSDSGVIKFVVSTTEAATWQILFTIHGIQHISGLPALPNKAKHKILVTG